MEPSSFFEDYESELEIDGEMAVMLEDAFGSDDEFDESTLFEIASLLQSSDVPSLQSLLPMRKSFSSELEYDISDGLYHELDEMQMDNPPEVNKALPPRPDDLYAQSTNDKTEEIVPASMSPRPVCSSRTLWQAAGSDPKLPDGEHVATWQPTNHINPDSCAPDIFSPIIHMQRKSHKAPLPLSPLQTSQLWSQQHSRTVPEQWQDRWAPRSRGTTVGSLDATSPVSLVSDTSSNESPTTEMAMCSSSSSAHHARTWPSKMEVLQYHEDEMLVVHLRNASQMQQT